MPARGLRQVGRISETADDREGAGSRAAAFARYFTGDLDASRLDLFPNLLPILEEPGAVAAIKATFKSHLWDLSRELQRGVIKSLSRVKSLRELEERLQVWRERLLSRERFPQPPIPGNDRLKPLTSAAEMRREAREMRSCLHKLIAEVFEGAVYFYSWHGSERATVLVVHSPGKLATWK